MTVSNDDSMAVSLDDSATIANGDSIGRQIVAILLAGAGLTLLAISPTVSITPWSRAGSSLEWAVGVLRDR